jgi:flagellin
MTFQVGANNDATNDRISVTIADSNTAVLGTTQTTATLTGSAISGTITDGQVKINGTSIGTVTATGTTNFAASVKSAIESTDSAVTATVGASNFSMGTFATISAQAAAADTYQLSVEGVDIFSTAHSLHSGTGADLTAVLFDAALDDRTADLATAGVTFTGTVAGGDLKFTKADGSNLVITETLTDTGGSSAEGGATFTAYGSVSLTSSANITVAGTSAITAGFHADNLSATAVGGTAVSALTVATTSGAQTALASLDNALSTVNSTRASIGSYQSAFETMISNLSVESENAMSARSRILDADFAQESAALAKTQVLQQAGISVLAQANAMPQQVLALLQ